MTRKALPNVGLVLLRCTGAMTLIATLVVYFNRKNIQRTFFAFVYTKFLAPHFVVPQLAPVKQKLFDQLKTLGTRDSKTMSWNSLRILEIGIGPGINLEYYPEETRLIAEDPNPHFLKYFESNMDRVAHVQVELFLGTPAEDMSEIECETVDVVVSTYVLCSVENCDAVMNEVLRVLVPGGRFIYLEHVGFPKGSWHRVFQKLIEPVWRTLTDGCRLTNETSAYIKSAGFTTVEERLVYPTKGLLYPIKPHIVGTAIK